MEDSIRIHDLERKTLPAVRSRVTFLDRQGQPCIQSAAVHVLVEDFDQGGMFVGRQYGAIG